MATKKWNTEQYREETLVAFLPMPANVDALANFTSNWDDSVEYATHMAKAPLQKSTQTEIIRVVRLAYELRASDTSPNNVEVWAVYTVEHKTVVA